MAKLEPLQLDVITDSDDKGLTQAERGVLNFSQSAIDASKKIVAAYAVVGTAFVGAATFGIKMAGDMEAARQGFVALLGDADKADATMQRIKKEAAATPFELPGLTAGTQALAAITKDGDKAIDMLLNVGKAVATSGKGQFELDRVVQNLQQVSSTGQLTEADLKQFRSAIPIFDDIVGSIGMTVDELKESGNAAELLQLAFAEAGKEGGITAAGFTAQAGTWNQLFSNFKDNIGIIASEFVTQTGIFDMAKQALGGIVDVMGKFATPEAFKQFMAWLKDHKDVVTIFAAAIAGPLVAAFVLLAGAAWAALAPILAFAAPFVLIGALVGLLYVAFTNNFLGIRDIVMSVIGFITDKIFPALVVGFNVVKTALTILWDIFVVAWAAIKFLVGAAVDWIANTAFGKTLIGGFKWVTDHIKEFKEGWDKFWQGVQQTVKGAVDGIVNWVKGMVDKVKGFVNDIINAANRVGEKIPGFVKLPTFASGVTNFSGGAALVGERGPEIVNLPRGSDVIPNNRIGEFLTPQPQRAIEVNQYIQDPIDLDFAMRELAYVLRTN